MILVGFGIGAFSFTALRGSTASAGGFARSTSTRFSASAPPCKTESMSGRPADFKLTTLSFWTTPACWWPLCWKVTNFMNPLVYQWRDNVSTVSALRSVLALTATALVCAPCFAQPHAAADLGKQVLAAGLDPAECYRVRDLDLSEEDIRFYLTDGYLMFGKPVEGAPLTAVFSADTDGGDAEVLLLPPDRSERKTMAAYAGSPNLDEHFQQAAFIFTEQSARGLLERVRASGARNAPDVGALMNERWGRVIANLMSGFESRIVLDLLTPGAKGG